MICHLCPRRCGAERTETAGGGVCGMPAAPVVARAGLHHWEEPVISGTRGSGAVVFSGCNLRCVFCQNHSISAEGVGKRITTARLREIFEELIAQGAHNINLVTPTHFVPWILPALEPPLPVPVVYNCGGYESLGTLRTSCCIWMRVSASSAANGSSSRRISGFVTRLRAMAARCAMPPESCAG